MQIVYHIGANCTDGDRLFKSLLKNAEAFGAQGIKVPGPGKYRQLIRETMENLNGATPAPDTREILLDAILDDENAERLILSNSTFMSFTGRIFNNGVLYEEAPERIAAFQALFPEDDIEIHLALRNPATLIPTGFASSKKKMISIFLGRMTPEEMRWSDLIIRIKERNPDVGLTVWCNEDTPLIWAQLIREISGVGPLEQISGGFDLLSTIMSTDGMQRFLSYLKSHPPQTEMQKRRIIAAFLDKYALDEEIEVEVDLPGWTEERIDYLTELYEDDVQEIARMSGVNFIAP